MIHKSDGLTLEHPMFYGLERPWEEVMPEVMRGRFCLPPGKEEERTWLAWVKPWVDKSPIPVNDVFDFGWWVSFSLKWQYDCLRVFLNRERMSKELFESVEHFYASDNWQQWIYKNHRRRMLSKQVYASFKEPLKKYIWEFDNDQEYYAAKAKVASVSMHFGYQLGLTDSFHVLQFGALSCSRLRMVEKYGDLLQETFLE